MDYDYYLQNLDDFNQNLGILRESILPDIESRISIIAEILSRLIFIMTRLLSAYIVKKSLHLSGYTKNIRSQMRF